MVSPVTDDERLLRGIHRRFIFWDPRRERLMHAKRCLLMLLARHVASAPPKGWYTDLLQPGLPAIGFANEGIAEPHYHQHLREVYLVARGTGTLVVDGRPVVLSAGDVAVVEPGEVHTFTESSLDYFHFVLHCPPSHGDKVAMPA